MEPPNTLNGTTILTAINGFLSGLFCECLKNHKNLPNLARFLGLFSYIDIEPSKKESKYEETKYFNFRVMRKVLFYLSFMLLASTMLTACSNDDDYVIPSDFNGKWQLLYEEYGDGRRDTVKQGEIVNFTENKEIYYINMREGTLKKNFGYDEWAMYKYQFMENGLRLKLVFVDSKEEIITPMPTEIYQKIK